MEEKIVLRYKKKQVFKSVVVFKSELISKLNAGEEVESRIKELIKNSSIILINQDFNSSQDNPMICFNIAHMNKYGVFVNMDCKIIKVRRCFKNTWKVFEDLMV